MSVLPLTFPDKENSPELEAYLAQFGEKFYLSADEINLMRDAINEIFSGSGTATIVSEEWKDISVSGSTSVNITELDFKKNINITSFSSGSFFGFTGVISKIKPGNIVRILNSTSLIVPIINESDTSGVLPFVFIPRENYNLKPGEAISFIRLGSTLYYLGTNSSISGVIRKDSEKWTNIILAGAPGTISLMYANESVRKLNITGSPNNVPFGGFHNAGGSVDALWDGSGLMIRNGSPNPQTLKHLAPTAVLKLFFQNEEDYIIQPGEIVFFTELKSNMQYEFLGTSRFFLREDIKVSLQVGKSLGKYVNGDTIPCAGWTFDKLVKDLAAEVLYPELTTPSVTGSAGSAVEVGTATKAITVTFNRGDVVGKLEDGVWNPTAIQGNVLGDRTKVWIDGIDNGTSLSRTISKTTVLGSNSIPIAVDYAAGIQPKDSINENFGTPAPAGTLSNTVTWQGFYYRTAMAGTSVPTASQVRAATAKRSNAGVINLGTGTTATRFDVFVPQGSVLTQVLDEGNLNLDITSEFVLQGSDFSGLDAGGGEVLYKHYVRLIDNPYPVSSNLKITVT
jgi:hypothetical protein